MRGNILNIAIDVHTTGTTPVWKTVAQATGQKISVQNTLSDIATKDINGKLKEVTARAWTLSTNNLICLDESGAAETGVHISSLKTYQKNGTALPIKVTSTATITEDGETHIIVKDILSGNAIITKLDANYPNKENSSYSCKLNGVGPYTVGSN